MSSDVMVFYHGGGCRDGFTAAWCLYKLHPDAEFVPINYGEEMPAVNGKRLIFADFCPPETDLLRLIPANTSVTVLDHHSGVGDRLSRVGQQGEGSDYRRFNWVFDPDKSGARLAWEYFVDQTANWHLSVLPATLAKRDNPPWLVQYVEDRDLWSWKLPDSQAVNAGIRLTPMTFEAWNRMEQCAWQEFAADGGLILKRDEEIIKAHVTQAVEREMFGHKVPVVNATTLHSEIGNALCEGRPFSDTYYDDLKAGVRRWSLRSKASGMNVTKLAQSVWGGGHPSGRAAGFEEKLK
jgi:uncharacterized protein